MGSISKELRGLNVKNWAELQLLLNCSGPRVKSGKSQGLFNKRENSIHATTTPVKLGFMLKIMPLNGMDFNMKSNFKKL